MSGRMAPMLIQVPFPLLSLLPLLLPRLRSASMAARSDRGGYFPAVRQWRWAWALPVREEA
ncbi:hypothetical protein TW86_20955 [Halomonas sp. S2151]|uniref:Uncharacterized protein n=1 Tax=Halomonas litopenaei TaxID=2109328 RepID=A0ABX5J2F8_9GAMM|nr:hypothetical protein TW86_20955 [Halomonas sp. S2151]MAR74245.1 hypothetical protein [Halomonas sp.]MBS8268623.1 hypothetical protein [Halomonas litopenaei]PTL93721.1 hypothetical protein C6W89_00770 [Halomonas sp. SYSU XM8]PTL96609.1 hypothetical protein C6W88_04395 [Halomonas litopenaei]